MLGRTEQEWRRLALEVRPLLRELIAVPAEADALDRELARALDRPEGAAKSELRRILTGRDEIRVWLRRHYDIPDTGYRRAPERAVRFLEVSVPESIAVGRAVPLHARILLWHADQAVALQPFDVPAGGATVTIVVSSASLDIDGAEHQELTVPRDADSKHVRFDISARTPGTHAVLVQAFRGGTLLGETTRRITAGADAQAQKETAQRMEIPSMGAEPREATLLVHRQRDHYTFQLLSETISELVRTPPADGDPAGDYIKSLLAELGRMAAGDADLDSAILVRSRLRNMGAGLWSDLIPKDVKEQFWEMADRISHLTLAGDLDVAPWELLYVSDKTRELGFLAEKVPVVRKVSGKTWMRRLSLPSVTYVVPPRDAATYIEELTTVRRRLAGLTERGVIENLDELQALIESGPEGVLHFAGHHAFSDVQGGSIELHGGKFCLVDLELAASRGAWSNGPLVFFNGCRTAGEVARITGRTGWAAKFLKSGASAFVGSLWDVRSKSATLFADAFYKSFIQLGSSLGEAVLAARNAVGGETGDTTGLAYAVYGASSTTVAGRGLPGTGPGV